jgi:hypothetical protein
MDIETFKRAAHNNNKSVYSDEELLEQIETLQCLVAYFQARREMIISFALILEQRNYENMAHARRWECKNEKWQIRRADGTFA